MDRLTTLQEYLALDAEEFFKCIFYSSNTFLGMAGVVNIAIGSASLGRATSQDGSIFDGGLSNTALRSLVVAGRRSHGYAAVFLGFTQLAVAIFGCMGPIRESACMLKSYWMMAIGQVVWNFIIMCIVSHMLHQANFNLETRLKETMEKYDGKGNFNTFYIDLMQVKLECCGIHGQEDFRDTPWFLEEEGGGVPASCCTLRSGERRYKYGLWAAEYRPLRPADLVVPMCAPFPAHRAHTDVPCLERIREDCKQHLVFALVISIVSMAIQSAMAYIARQIEIILADDEDDD